jgi:hypothetical protein
MCGWAELSTVNASRGPNCATVPSPERIRVCTGRVLFAFSASTVSCWVLRELVLHPGRFIHLGVLYFTPYATILTHPELIPVLPLSGLVFVVGSLAAWSVVRRKLEMLVTLPVAAGMFWTGIVLLGLAWALFLPDGMGGFGDVAADPRVELPDLMRAGTRVASLGLALVWGGMVVGLVGIIRRAMDASRAGASAPSSARPSDRVEPR